MSPMRSSVRGGRIVVVVINGRVVGTVTLSIDPAVSFVSTEYEPYTVFCGRIGAGPYKYGGMNWTEGYE